MVYLRLLAVGGKESLEFMALTEAGEDVILKWRARKESQIVSVHDAVQAIHTEIRNGLHERVSF
jgi:hypothetical protein